MVKKLKSKSRLDKYYKLAKDTGYRSRAAFKLLQLQDKFNFLSCSNVLVDLCAAPGGWLQAAAAKMPVNSLIVGVDLVQIKPLRGATTFVGDITTASCLAKIQAHTKNLKVDTVLHDGAPNVGTSWESDAFTQNSLVLSALKLSTKLLRAGGCFVTKVFRSADYNSLLWVFNQLFDSVTATKPKASRSTSAEIFVVCMKFKAPKKIDPELLSPKNVFMESEDIVEKHTVSSVSQLVPSKVVKRKPMDETRGLAQFRRGTLARFVECTNPFQFLADYDELTAADIESQEYIQVESFSAMNQQTCRDIRLAGRPELSTLIKWRRRVLKQFNAAQKQVDSEQKEHTETDSEEELQTLIEKQTKKQKREHKKQRAKDKKLEKVKNKLTDIYEDQELFTTQDPAANGIDTEAQEYSEPEPQSEDLFYEEDEDYDDLSALKSIEQNLNYHYESTLKKRKLEEEPDQLKGLVDSSIKKEEASRWFQREEFADIEHFQEQTHRRKKKTKQPQKQPKADFEVIKQEYPESEDPEAMTETIALATAMLRKKRRREILNYTYNRYCFEDPSGLPEWFQDDQKNYYQAPLPVTTEELKEARNQVEAFNRRPIKKVMEAIGRRKRKLAKSLERIKPKAEAIAGQTELSEGLKVKEIQKLYKKEIHLNKPKKKYIVSRKVHRGKYTQRPGRNIRYVDKRLKKDKRAMKKGK